jgi:hypothetical protein
MLYRFLRTTYLPGVSTISQVVLLFQTVLDE